jgi:hypothetical protein
MEEISSFLTHSTSVHTVVSRRPVLAAGPYLVSQSIDRRCEHYRCVLGLYSNFPGPGLTHKTLDLCVEQAVMDLGCTWVSLQTGVSVESGYTFLARAG